VWVIGEWGELRLAAVGPALSNRAKSSATDEKGHQHVYSIAVPSRRPILRGHMHCGLIFYTSGKGADGSQAGSATRNGSSR